MAICGQCGQPIKEDAKFCGGCGATRPVPTAAVEATADLAAAPTAALVCPTCGKALAKPGATFCGSCGAKIDAPAVPAPPAPAPPPAPSVQPAPPPPQAPAKPPDPQIQATKGVVPSPPKPAAAPAVPLPAPGTKKKGSPILMILVIVMLVGCVLLAAAGVGGYFVWKKAKAKAAAKLAEVTQQMDQQAQEAQTQAAESQLETPSETPPESAPSTAEPAPTPQEEPAQSTPAPASPKTKSAPAPSPGTVKHSDPTQDIATDQVRADDLDQPLIAPPVTAPIVAPVQTATLGIILESQAPGTKMVVKIDGAKVYEEDMPATKAAIRIAKEFTVTAGPHHIRVAVWRPPQPPVAGEWDFTFDPGSHPVFRIDLQSDWKMDVKRFQ